MTWRQSLESISGVSAIDDDLPYGREQLIYQLSPAGESLGLSITDIGRQLRAAYDGIILQRFQQGADEVEVRLQLPDSEQRRLDSLLHLPIKLPNGGFVALETVANWRSAQGFETLRHFNGSLSVDVSADVNAALNNTAEIVADLNQFTLPALASKYGIQYSVEGRSASQRETFTDMRLGAIVALTLMYLVLAWVFSSYGWPLLGHVDHSPGTDGCRARSLANGHEFNDLVAIWLFWPVRNSRQRFDNPRDVLPPYQGKGSIHLRCAGRSRLPTLARRTVNFAYYHCRIDATAVRNFAPGAVPDTDGSFNCLRSGLCDATYIAGGSSHAICLRGVR